MDTRPHIVVVEDEATQRQLLLDYLGRQNFRVSGADGGTALRRIVEHDPPALVLLDVGLPGENGFVLARWLREKSGRIGIIMVTASSDTVDRVVGLETGADDYIGKPFSRPELLARVESVLRRQRRADAAEDERLAEVRSGALVIDLSRHLATFNGEPMRLTTKEFELLAHLAAHPGRIFTRDQLLTRIWPFDFGGDSRTVDVHVSWLRSKLRALDGHNYFRTVRGVGYAFAPRQADGH